MNTNWEEEEILEHQDFPSTLRYMERIRDLRILLESAKNRLAQLGKKPTRDEDLISRERIILEATQKEVRRLERKAIYFELGE